MNTQNNSTKKLEHATEYLRRGWQPLPIPHRSKNPGFQGWQNFKTNEADLPKHFNGAAQNIGVLLGAKSNGLTDIDLDSVEAVKIADYFLPKTESEFGRDGKPRSHRLYISDFPKIEKFEYVETIVEIRTTGGQTVFPPSTHKCGENVEWHTDGEPLQVSAQNLRRAVARLASACLFATVWHHGKRQDLTLALSGALLRNGFDTDATKNFIRAVCVATGDEETADRMKAIEATAQKLENGGNIYGFPTLVELTDPKLVDTICKWLQIEARHESKAEPDYKTDEFTDTPNQKNEKSPLRPLKTVKMSEVKAEKVEWLWNPFVPIGTLTLIDGEEGIGKSLIALQGLGCAVATGKGIDTTDGLSFPDTEVGTVLLMSAEESLSFVVKPRLQAVDAPCDRFIAIDEPFTLDSDGIIRLSMAIAEYAPKLVIIDPLFSYTGKVRLNDDNEIRSVTDPLTRLAEKFSCAIIGIRHINKSKGFGDARNAGLNGVGWRAAARSALLVGIDKETGETAIVQTKTNLAEKSKKAFGYKIESAQITLETGETISAPKLFWTGESEITAETMLSAIRSETSEEKSEKQDAIAFLRETLNGGQKTSVVIFAEAKKIGISEATLKRAKSALGIKSVKRGGTFGGELSWFWEMPSTEDAQANAEDAQRNNLEHLQSNEASKGSHINGLAEDAHVSIFSPQNPNKPTEDAHVSTFSQAIGNKGSYTDTSTEGAQVSISEHLQSNNEHLQQKDDETEYFD